MNTWTAIRALHLAGIAFFVGGQLLLVVAVVPVLAARGEDDGAMHAIARRFGIASAAALLLVVGTGVAMASHFRLWDDPALQLKLVLFVFVLVLVGLHIASPQSRPVQLALPLLSLVVLWLGVRLTFG